MCSRAKTSTSHLLSASKIGLGKTRYEVMRIVEGVAKQKGVLRGEQISHGWWQRFLDRNLSLSLRSGDSTAGVRIDAVNEENMRIYFNLLKEVYDELDFAGDPERIFNMDETGMPLEPRPPKVVAHKGVKKVPYRCSGQMSQITVMIIGCASATGHVIPPFIIFAAKQLNSAWMKDEVAGSRYAVSDNGWIDQELFHYWMIDHFLMHAVASRPLLLLLDGRSSHFRPDTIQFAKDNDNVFFCLPPHTDCSLFGPLKTHWRNVCHAFHQAQPSAVINKFNFCGLFKEAWLRAVTPDNVIGGFRKAGVYPYDPTRVSALKHAESNGDKSTSTDVDGPPSDESCSGEDPPVDHQLPDGIGDRFLGDDGIAQDGGDNVNGTGSTYTGKEEIYQMRFEEGYDLYDPDYILWLELHHPEAVPKYRYTLTCAPTAEHSSESSTPSNIPCVLSLGGSASSLSLSDPSLVTPQLTAKTALPGGSASSLSLSDPSLGTPQSKTKTTPLVIQQVVCL